MATEPDLHPAPRLVSVIIPVRDGAGTIDEQTSRAQGLVDQVTDQLSALR